MPLTRRQLLRHAALVSATFPAAGALASGWRLAARAQAGLALPIHLELVTVTDSYAVVTWFTGDPSQPDEFGRPAPVAAPGRVLVASAADPTSWVEVGAHEPTPYHYVEIHGLQPGTTYLFRAESAGIPAVPTQISPLSPDLGNLGTFTTLTPPGGRELARIVWVNDLHIGEQVSGLAISNDALPGGGFPPGFAADPDAPYWRTMARAVTAEAAARGATLLLANGDLSGAAQPAAVNEARDLLDAFGVLGGSSRVASGEWHHGPGQPRAYFATRGNHDRGHAGELYADCPPADHPSPDLRDCFLDAFAPGFDPGTGRFTVTVGDATHRYRFVGLDSNDLATGEGHLPDGELEYLENQLAAGDATIPLFHHIVGDLSTVGAMPPVIFGVEPRQAQRFRQLIAGHDNVVGVYNGHTHRNRRTTSLETGSVPYFEGAAVKEYPGGYTIVRLFEEGYQVNFHTVADPEGRAWAERSRGEYLGLYPYYTMGGLAERNWTFEVDARVRAGADGGIRPSPGANPDQAPIDDAVGGTELPSSGGGWAAAGAAAVLAASTASRSR